MWSALPASQAKYQHLGAEDAAAGLAPLPRPEDLKSSSASATMRQGTVGQAWQLILLSLPRELTLPLCLPVLVPMPLSLAIRWIEVQASAFPIKSVRALRQHVVLCA